jgi:dTDP-4-amino-4,6-dideoxygalactose transaminase
VCDSGYLNEGEQVAELERKLLTKLGLQRGVLLNSCTSALELALSLCENKGSTVISTPMTCVATNMAIVRARAGIEWADIDPDTGCIDPADVERILARRNPRTIIIGDPHVKAVMCVDWAGNVCDLDALRSVCRRYSVPLIHDAAHAFGARWHGKSIAEHADFTAFSFQAIKHFTTGDGGMLVCDHPDDHARARRMKWFGLDRDAAKDARGDWRGQQWDVDIHEQGGKLNMNNIAAAVGLTNLESIDWILQRHRHNAGLYERAFKGTDVKSLRLHGSEQSLQVSSRWVYTVRVAREKRDSLLMRLNRRGIKAGLVHVPNDDYTVFRRYKRDLPGVREFAATQLSLPCGWWMDPSDTLTVATAVLEELHGD